MKRALIIGNSGGIGGAVMAQLQAEGVTCNGLSRSVDGLDVTQEASVERALGALEGPFDLIFVATGALNIGGAQPEKTLDALTPEAMMDQFRLNTIGPALVVKHARRLLPRRDSAVLAVLSARVGSIGDNRLGGWYSYRVAKAAVNQMVHGAAIELARTHKGLACVTMHPGTVATPFTARYASRHPTVPPEVAARRLIEVMRGLTPADTGRFVDYTGDDIPW